MRCTFSRESLGAGERFLARTNQHNVAIGTEHLPLACGGHDVRKGTPRVRASGVSRFEQSVTRGVTTRRATSPCVVYPEIELRTEHRLWLGPIPTGRCWAHGPQLPPLGQGQRGGGPACGRTNERGGATGRRGRRWTGGPTTNKKRAEGGLGQSSKAKRAGQTTSGRRLRMRAGRVANENHGALKSPRI